MAASPNPKKKVRVWAGVRSVSTAETFDQLRVESYINASVRVDVLPPTSSVIRGHIERGAFLVHRECHLLTSATKQGVKLDPEKHGWQIQFGTLVPTKYLKPLPSYLLTICKCVGKCDTRRCVCYSAGVQCVIFCHGKTVKSSCQNPSKKV